MALLNQQKGTAKMSNKFAVRGASIYNIATLSHTDTNHAKQVFSILNKGYSNVGNLPKKIIRMMPRGKAYSHMYALGFRLK